MRPQPPQVLPQVLPAVAGRGILPRFLSVATRGALVEAMRPVVVEELAKPGA
ncbi:MAG: hypothetical protein AAB224_03020 [Gemmatimonadota bacterium]